MGCPRDSRVSLCVLLTGKASAGCFAPARGGGVGFEQMASSKPALSFQGTLTAMLSTENGAPVLLPYQFRMEEIEGFRYRCRVSGSSWRGRGSPPSQTPAAEHRGTGEDRAAPRSPILTFGVYAQDAMRSVTKQAIREARLKEIKEELLHSERLKVMLSVRGGRRIIAAEFVLGTHCHGEGSPGTW